MVKIDKHEVLALHDMLIQQTGGSSGIRDYGMLDSAVSSPYQTFDGQDIYPSVEEKAARLGYSLICNHAFIDGNKRIGMLVMLTMLELNGITVACEDNDIINLGLSVASSTLNYYDMLDWIENHKINLQENNLEM